MTYGFTRVWYRLDGREECSVSGYSSALAAYDACDAFSRKLGWRPRRWWEFWRWREIAPQRPVDHVGLS